MEFTTASIVLYKSKLDIVSKTIKCYLENTNIGIIYLIDNSPDDKLQVLKICDQIVYIKNDTNVGFGSAHNVAVKSALSIGSKYHFIINPDIYFGKKTLSGLVDKMNSDNTIGMIMPEILFPNGGRQYLPKLLPSPFHLILRKFHIKAFLNKYEFRKVDKELAYSTPFISGCFFLLRLDIVNEIGAFDERFFMYFEDLDFSRRVNEKYKTLYYPQVSVYHYYQSEANKKLKLFLAFIKSGFSYFNKWGWLFDFKRNKQNKMCLEQFKTRNEKQFKI